MLVDLDKLIQSMTLEEKILFLTGASGMTTNEIERLKIPGKRFADGPHGVRIAKKENCTMFPSLCCVGATWDTELVYKMGQALAEDCIAHGVDMLLGPGMNIKRTPLCGRNFEYLSEDPVITGELGAAYINGLQSHGVGACPKHYAANNQERHRLQTSVEVDERVLHEIYLKGFEIAVKKSKPMSIMCAYNKLQSIWCSENKYLLSDVLKQKWGYEGFVMSDWGAVRDICKALMAGLDLQMPKNPDIEDQIKTGLQAGKLTQQAIDAAVKTVLRFVLTPKPKAPQSYDRDRLHALARKIASDGMVVLKNDHNALPLTAKKYKKIAVMGEYAVNPLVVGQGSGQVNPMDEYVDNPLNELKKSLGDEVEIVYEEFFMRSELPKQFIWGDRWLWQSVARHSDAVVVFLGPMESEETEQFDRRTMEFNPNFDFILDMVSRVNDNVIAVIQSGSAMIMGDWKDKTAGIVQMWYGGEGAGGAIADVLTGKVNPSGKLPETFPKVMRKDLEYPGDGLKVRYKEDLEVGYRYYDKHPDEIEYPFGHGLSYTSFAFSDLSAEVRGDQVQLSLTLENTGEYDGAEVVQVYVGKKESCVTRPVKELKAFRKVFVKRGQKKAVTMSVDIQELAYYNVLLDQWVVEPGQYEFMIGASSQDIRCTKHVMIDTEAPYTIDSFAVAVVG